MKKILLLIVFSLSVSFQLTAQNRSRVFDNFDTTNGVSVATPTVKSIVSSKSTKSAGSSKQAMNANEGMGLNNAADVRLVMGSTEGMRGFTTGDPVVDVYITDSCRRHNIDPLLIYSQMHQESAFKKRATSYKGASGLMQLMPATARRFGVTEIYNPRQNIDAGVKYMRWLLDKFGGDVRLALAGYNAGEGAVMKYGNNIPPYRETQEYVRRITSRYQTIGNGSNIQTVKKADSVQIAKIKKEEIRPLTTYEPDVLTVTLPDGRMRLVSQ